MDYMSELLKWAKYAVIAFVIIYPTYLYRNPIKKGFINAALWIRKNILKKEIKQEEPIKQDKQEKTEVDNNGDTKQEEGRGIETKE